LPQDIALQPYLQPSDTIDSDHATIRQFAAQTTEDADGPQEKAVRLYDAVRDGIRYDPYGIDLSVNGLRASGTLKKRRGWCVSKAVLLAAACRAAGIPARLGFADVRNHLSTERMRAQMQTDVFYWHGYTSIYLNGNWVKATPAFNIELCERFRLKPLAFDGRSDAIYHAFDLQGHRHMEYLGYRGEFQDVPIDRIRETFRKAYTLTSPGSSAAFVRDVDRETAPREN
jgi:transglutaminase-like putative cysteine protease